MKKNIKNLINQCGCIDIKIVVLLFLLLVIIYSLYFYDKEDCECGN